MYQWIVDEFDNVVALERTDPITNLLSYAMIDDKGALDKLFRTSDTGDLTGIVPDRYLTQYKNYLKRKKEN